MAGREAAGGPFSVKRLKQAGALAILVAAATGVSVLALAPNDGNGDAPQDVSPLPVSAITARLSDGYVVERSYVGQIVPRRRSDLAFERGGLVAEVLVDDGAGVARGDVIARLDTARLDAERTRLEAQLRQVDAQLASARLTEDRRQQLVERGHSSRAAFDDARFSARALEAQKDSVEAAIQAIDVDISKATLYAPFDGIVSNRSVDEGAVIAAGQIVLRLHEAGRLEARIGIPARLADRVSERSQHHLLINGRIRTATVAGVAPVVDSTTRTVETIFTLENGDFVPEGAIVRLVLGRRIDQRGFWLPASALSEGLRGLWKVYVLEPTPDRSDTFRIVREEVEVLHVAEERIFVRGTLEDGEQVVASGGHRLVPGQLVRLAPADGPEPTN